MREEGMKKEGQYVVFRLGDENYGIDVNHVREIITMQKITEVPGTREFIEGVINLRGYVIPVFNLRKKFSLPEREVTRATRIVVVEVEGEAVGIIVDEVYEVLRLAREEIERPSPSIVAGIDSEYIKGIAKLERGLVILLDLERVLQREGRSSLESTA